MATPLICIPGLLNTARLWQAQIQGLARVCEVRVADSAAADLMVGLAERLLATAPPKFSLAALSMGGYVAFEVLRQAPARVERLALIDTTARPDKPEQSVRRRMLMDLAQIQGIDKVLPYLVPGFLAPAHRDDATLNAVIADMAHEVGAAGFRRQQHAIMHRPDSRLDLAKIACPTVVLVGEHDQLTGVEIATEMVDGIAGAKLVTIADAGHLSPLENPDAVTAALKDWLS